MTRRHYVLLSAALLRARLQATSDAERRGTDRAAMRVAEALSAVNPNGFDKERFLTDSGITRSFP